MGKGEGQKREVKRRRVGVWRGERKGVGGGEENQSTVNPLSTYHVPALVRVLGPGDGSRCALAP